MTKSKLKAIPKFKNEDEERKFWAKEDTTEYFDTSKPVELDLSELKLSTKSITIRLPESLLASLKNLAHKKDIPYQSLVKMYLSQIIKEEYRTV